MSNKNDTETDPHYMTLRALVKDMAPKLRNQLARAIVAENAALTEKVRGGPAYLWNRVHHAIDNAERTGNDQCVQCKDALNNACLSFGNGFTYCGPGCRDEHDRATRGK